MHACMMLLCVVSLCFRYQRPRDQGKVEAQELLLLWLTRHTGSNVYTYLDKPTPGSNLASHNLLDISNISPQNYSLQLAYTR